MYAYFYGSFVNGLFQKIFRDPSFYFPFTYSFRRKQKSSSMESSGIRSFSRRMPSARSRLCRCNFTIFSSMVPLTIIRSVNANRFALADMLNPIRDLVLHRKIPPEAQVYHVIRHSKIKSHAFRFQANKKTSAFIMVKDIHPFFALFAFPESTVQVMIGIFRETHQKGTHQGEMIHELAENQGPVPVFLKIS